MDELRDWFRKRNAFHYHKHGEKPMIKYKVFMYDAYGKLQRDFTIGGAVELSSAVQIGNVAKQAFPGMAVILQPELNQQMVAIAAHA